jgi:hypothetical protein
MSDLTFLSKKIVFFYFFSEKTSDPMFLNKKIFLLFNEKTSDLTFLSKKIVFFYFLMKKHQT